MSILIAILGLAFLILVHECGHFFASLAVGLRPRRFYVGFPPAVAKRTRNGIEYAIGAIPLGGFVTIPGMHRPIPHDAERRFAHAVEDAPTLGGSVDRVKRSLEGSGSDLTGAQQAVDDLDEELATHTLSPGARASAEKGITELRDALGPDAYWKAPTWKRLVAIGAGPAANILLAVVIFTFLFATSGRATSYVGSVGALKKGATSPAQQIGLVSGDRIVAINGHVVDSTEIPDAINQSAGREITLTIERDGKQVVLGPVETQLAEGRYRLGFSLGAEGIGLVPSVGHAFEATGIISKEIVKSIGRLFTGEGRDEVSSPIGITRASADAAERGADSYLWMLGLISLSLALLNLLPLLPLDGGHILFTLIEGARGRFLRREIYERVSLVGLAVVLLLFFVGLSNDIDKLS